jgi:pantetheine-phosphate adenylyltransferase
MAKEKIAVFPGTFDPITLGHVDVIKRAASLFDKVHVVIGVNRQKQTLFDKDERKEMAIKCLKDIPNAEVHRHFGLIVDYAKEVGASAIIRGIRAVSDLDYEFQLAQTNRKLEEEICTVFMAPRSDYTFLNSSLVRELAYWGKDTTIYVDEYVAEKLEKRIAERYKEGRE